ncbi:NAD(P)-dependent glycerol-3-phosphate dehydrogenase [Patescibacteria group bacterium]|nr:NAD(P)-dependent glycerol-3-phosphate dehydrogenase [Patescibacteria group bacterium]MBU1015612.1 NAD(P)-dependent glycerol-3-phosphate dehydrogenase [Patescibacteria group bacterium]MBU1684723.1 NAD(P)-dependent glycerol-3-phosphate dehydrogenase [Patescibacteria group bacterium]MBU1938342.1 NAD(P)-dependent glycerol-3-phosphate dehydrogenase [Patescibacteria group bacterium]
MKKRISIIGAGNMGTAMALVLADNGYNVKCWDINDKVVKGINEKHENKLFLPGVRLPKNIIATGDIKQAVYFSNVLILSVPSQFLRSTLRMIPKEDLQYEILVNCAKGIDLKTGQFMSEIVAEELGVNSQKVIADLSGPSIANELIKKTPTAIMVASKNEQVLGFLQNIFNNDYFKVHPSTDVIGTELGGVMKNIYSVAIGIADSLMDSMNTRALLLTQGLSEMTELGLKMGATKEVFYSLSGIGDLIATCLSTDSRNHRFGQLLGKGKSVEEAQKKVKQVTEGYFATKAIHHLAKKHGVKLPLADNMYQILYNKKDPKKYLLKDL